MKPILSMLLFLYISCTTGAPPPDLDPAHQARLQAGDLEIVIADNEAFGDDHRAGYNGIALLRHRSEPRPLFPLHIAGLNLEHIFDGTGRQEAREEFFEPRNAPMHLRQLSPLSAELHQPPTPYHKLESRTTFTLTPPHYIDFTFECTPRADTYPRGYLGLFWASYINAPENLGLYTLGKRLEETKLRWLQHTTGFHNDRSTLRPLKEQHTPTFVDDHGATLFINFAEERYANPFFYGRYGDMVFCIMFDRTEGIRLTHSPMGAGRNEDGTTNPAWDWQWFVFNPQVNATYSFNARVVYKPWTGRADIIREYETWSGKTVTLTE